MQNINMRHEQRQPVTAKVLDGLVACWHAGAAAAGKCRLVCLCLVMFHTYSLQAATLTWDGGASGNNANKWSAKQNWGNTTNPVAGDLLWFGGTTALTPNNDTSADTIYNELRFLAGAGAFTLTGNRITLGGNVVNNSSNLQSIDLAMILSGTRTFFTNTDDIAVGGVISGTGSLVKDGSQTLTLSAANTFTGDTVIKQGTLQLTGSLASSNIIVGDTGSSGSILEVAGGFLVNSGQTIRGIGTVIASTTYQSGSTMSPGNSGSGILTNDGDINFQSGSLLAIGLDGTTAGTGYDQLSVLGAVTLTGALGITMGFTPHVGDKFFILTNDGTDAISGTFSNAPVSGSIYTLGGVNFGVYYGANSANNSLTGGNDVALVVIPEPHTLMFCVIGSALLLRRCRK